MPYKSFCDRLEEFYSLFKGKYTDRDITDLVFLRALWHDINPITIDVVGGNTCFDLISSLEGSECDINNYEPFEGRYGRPETEIKNHPKIFGKFFNYKGKYRHHRKFVRSYGQLEENPDVLLINDRHADFTFFDTPPHTWPKTVIFSHYQWVACITKLITEGVPAVRETIPLQAMTDSMLCFSRQELHLNQINDIVEWKKFGDIGNVAVIPRQYQFPYKNFSSS